MKMKARFKASSLSMNKLEDMLPEAAAEAEAFILAQIDKSLEDNSTPVADYAAPEASEPARKKWSWPWNTKKEK